MAGALLPDVKSIEFFVPGQPRSAGSKTISRSGDKTWIREANPKAGEWKRMVALVATSRWHEPPLPAHVPIELELVFLRLRPKSHLRRDGSLTPLGQRCPYPLQAPDATKLTRGTEDALTGIIYTDDAQIHHQVIEKRWGDRPGVWITVRWHAVVHAIAQPQEALL